MLINPYNKMKELETVLSHHSNGTVNTRPSSVGITRSAPSGTQLHTPSQTLGYSPSECQPVVPAFSLPPQTYLPNPVTQMPSSSYSPNPAQAVSQAPRSYPANLPVQTQPLHYSSPSPTTTTTGHLPLPLPSPHKPVSQLAPPPSRHHHSAAQTITEPIPSPIRSSQPRGQQPAKSKESYIDRGLTSAELDILRRTSTINGTVFLPWDSSDSNITDVAPFADPYDYNLTNRQKQRGGHFIQPMEKYSSCCVVNYPIDPNCVRQNSVADCTIISSMISCANYEMRFKKPLISSIIFPQQGGRPVYSRSGKYRVKLYFNGIPRRVDIDHRILVDERKNELCTFSKNVGELWPTLIEKANLKVHGGYSYDGGNGSQDTYALTGWIPEYFPIDDKNSEELWKKVSGAFK